MHCSGLLVCLLALPQIYLFHPFLPSVLLGHFLLPEAILLSSVCCHGQCLQLYVHEVHLKAAVAHEHPDAGCFCCFIGQLMRSRM